MDPLSILVLVVVGYLLVKAVGGGVSPTPGIPGLPAAALPALPLTGLSVAPTNTIAAAAELESGNTYSRLGPGSDPAGWFHATEPGTVTIGGQPAPDGWNPSKTAQTAASITGAGVSATMGIAAAIGQTAQGGALASTTMLGSVIPVIGVAAAAAGVVISVIEAHHQVALAAEGKALNDADPRMENALVMVLQAVLAGEISDQDTADQYISQVVADWYGEVKNIQRGTWPYTLTPAQDPSILEADTSPGVQNWFGATIAGDARPSVCNAACTVGHYYTERNAAIARNAIANALAGEHGVMTFPTLPPHDTQSGFPEVMVTY